MRKGARVWIAAGISLAAAAAIAGWALWPGSPAATPATARQYLDVTACLLTSPSGVTAGTPAAPVWAAMQDASVASHVMVSYLPDTGPADVPLMLNTLIERQCGVIITTGTASTATRIITTAKANPHQRFLLVVSPGTAARALPPNAEIVSATDAAARIGQLIHALAAQPR